MKTINPQLKVFEIAREMFGSNKNEYCRAVKVLLRHCKLEEWDKDSKDCLRIIDTNLKDDCGWFIPNSCLI